MRHLYITGITASLLLTACGGDSSPSFTIPATPTPAATNHAPLVALVNNDKAATVGEEFTYDATQGGGTFSDADGDALTYSVTYSPSANGLSDTAGVISGTPTLDGIVSVTVTASDGNGGSVSDNFHIVISPAGTDQSAVEAMFAGRIDLDNLENYANQTVPAYITKLETGGNPISDSGATLGRVLFYDTALSVNDTISCSSCHVQATGFSDTDVVSNGVEGGVTGRHSMRLINTQFADETRFFWDERAPSLEAQQTEPLMDHNEHGFSGENGRPDFEALLTKLEALEYYQELFTFAFGDPEVTEERLQTALGQFTKSIWSFDSKFDAGRAQVGDNRTDFPNYTADENIGKGLFFDAPNDGGAGCDTCHRSPEFDIRVNNGHNGVVGVAGSPTEFDFTNTRAPSLRDVVSPTGAPNGPFMHDGSLPTLLSVINHYDNIQAPANAAARAEFLATIDPLMVPNGNLQNLNLSEVQKQQIVTFLNTLSGSNVYTDTKWSNPF